MKLYYAPGACSLADHIALVEAGLPYALVKVDLRAKQTEDGRDFTAINSKGYVPALELDDGAVLSENIAILCAIAEMAETLIPAHGLPRWRVLEMTAFVSTEIHKNYKPFFNPAASDAEKDEARATLGKRFDFLDRALSERAFIVDDMFTIADCYLTVMLMWAGRQEIALPARLSAYLDRMRQHPSVKQALQEEGLA
jgi:glutathione S-transferase